MIAAGVILALGSLLWLALAFGFRRDEAYRKAMSEARRAQRLAKQRGDYCEHLLDALIDTQNRHADLLSQQEGHQPVGIVGMLTVPPWPRSEA